MTSKKFMMIMFSLVTAFTLAACAADNEEVTPDENTETDHAEMDHSDMDHSSSGDVPEGLQEAENPTYEVGSQAMIQDGHMAGMEGAEATIVGAYNTIAYVVSYPPTTGGDMVEDHKWVIHEELLDAGAEPLEPGTEVTLDADHMEGMKGATAEIDSAEATTVYMIDYTPTTGGDKVINHKWVTESELSSID